MLSLWPWFWKFSELLKAGAAVGVGCQTQASFRNQLWWGDPVPKVLPVCSECLVLWASCTSCCSVSVYCFLPSFVVSGPTLK